MWFNKTAEILEFRRYFDKKTSHWFQDFFPWADWASEFEMMRFFLLSVKKFNSKTIALCLLICDSKTHLWFWITRFSMVFSPDEQTNEKSTGLFAWLIISFLFSKMITKTYSLIESNKFLKFRIMANPISFWTSKIFSGSYCLFSCYSLSFYPMIFDFIVTLVGWLSNEVLSFIKRLRLLA